MQNNNESNTLSLFDENLSSKSSNDLTSKLLKATCSLEAAKIAYAFCKKKSYQIPSAYKNTGELLTEITARTSIIKSEHIDIIRLMIDERVKIENEIASSLITMTAKYKFKHKYKLIKSLNQVDIKKHGVSVLSAPHAMGKTELVGIPFIDYAGRERKACALVHLRSLTAEIAERFDAKNYQDLKEQVRAMVASGADREAASQGLFESGVHKISICAPSITSELSHYLEGTDTLLIDEISQLLTFIASDKLKLKAKAIFDKLVEMVAQANRVLVMDADMDDTVINFLELCRPRERFNIYELPRPQSTDFNVSLYCGENFLKDAENAILAALSANKRFIIACDSLKNSEAIVQFIQLHQPKAKTKILLVNKKTTSEKSYVKNKAQLEFMQKPNDHAHKYMVLVHSPTIRSGISITKGGFDLCIGVFQCETVTPAEAIQMIRRDRKNREFILCMAQSKYLPYNSVGEMILGTEQAASKREGKKVHASLFDTFIHQQNQKHAKAMSNFSTHFVIMLQMYGFNITHCQSSFKESAIREIKQQQQAEYEEMVLTSKWLPLEQAQEREQRGELELADLAQIEASKICALFNTDTITPEYYALWDEGKVLKKAQLLNVITGNDEQQTELTTDYSTNLFNDVKAKFINALITGTSLAIEDNAISGEITTQQEKPIARLIFKNKFMLARLGLITPKVSKMPKAPKEPKRIIKHILEHAGIELNSIQARTGERKDNKRERHLAPNLQNFDLIKKAAANTAELLKPPAEREQKSTDLANEAILEALEQDKQNRYHTNQAELQTWDQSTANKNQFAVLNMLSKMGAIEPHILGYELNKTYPITPKDFSLTLNKIFSDGLISFDSEKGLISTTQKRDAQEGEKMA